MMEVIKSLLKAGVDLTVTKLLPAAVIFVVGMIVVSIVMRAINALLEKSKLEKAAHSLIRSAAKIILYSVVILITAANLGIDVTGLVALASVLTLAISLSVQNALTNVIGGFTLLYTKPFVSGDFVEIAGQSGTVQEIGLTYTKLNTADNKLISIPNSAVVSAQIVNYTVTGTRRVEILVSASYNTPVDKALEALREAAKVETALDTSAPVAALKNYGESTIEYVLYVWCKSEDFWTTKFEVNRNIKTVFEDNSVEMTYPHLNVHLDK